MKNKKEGPETGKTDEYELGPRMKASVVDRLEDTLFTFAHASPQLEKLQKQLLQAANDDDFTSLSLTEIVRIVEQQATWCPLARKLHENLVRDIYMRAKHYRKWRGDILYLSENFVLSSDVPPARNNHE